MLRFPASFGHGAITFNEHLNADGTTDESKVSDTIVLRRREFDPDFRDLRDPLHLAQGGSLGRVHKAFGFLRLEGEVLVPDETQLARLADRETALRAAFDPYQCYLDSPATDGAYAFDFTEATVDDVTYPTGRIPLRYYGRPGAHPRLIENQEQASSLPFALGLIIPDPRRYEQTEQSLVLTPASAAGSLVNRGTTPAPLKATIVLSGNGASNFTISRGGVSFVLNLSSAGASTIVVIMETCGPYGRGRYITKGGSAAFSLKSSGPTTWLDVPVGTTAVSIANTTNVTSCTLAWYSARA